MNRIVKMAGVMFVCIFPPLKIARMSPSHFPTNSDESCNDWGGRIIAISLHLVSRFLLIGYNTLLTLYKYVAERNLEAILTLSMISRSY